MDVKTFPLHRYRLWALACFVALAAGRELDGKIHTLTHVTGRLHWELDDHSHFHAVKHKNGEAALQWLHDPHKVIPHLQQTEWPSNLVIGYATGYDFQTLKPLIYGFLANVKPPALLVLLSQSNFVPDMPANFSSRVVIQQHALPDGLEHEDLPHPVSLRFYVAAAFLELIRHAGSVFWLDTRDVFLQCDPFELPAAADGRLHFPRESSAYRLRGPYTDNNLWLLQCYGPETMAAIGGMYVLNSGTLLGPSQGLGQYFRLMMREFERRWHCRRLHGSDQVVHNYMVYTGKLIGSGLEFQIEDHITGHFAFVAYTHPAVWDFRAVSDEREELFNREGQPFVAIHLWPGDNRVANKVVLPFVAEFERCLVNDEVEACASELKSG